MEGIEARDGATNEFPVLMIIKIGKDKDLCYHVGQAKEHPKRGSFDIMFTDRFFGPRVDPDAFDQPVR